MAVVAERAAELEAGMVLANLLDFDTHYGHRGDALGFADCLEELDRALGGLLPSLRPGDLLAVTADHGNDPTAPGTDHTREWVPLLLHAPGREPEGGAWTGEMADLGRTVLDWLGVGAPATLAGRPIPWPGISRRPRT
jgi:phosphopentomutase